MDGIFHLYRMDNTEYMACATLADALACVGARFAPAAPQQPLYYHPDPTPFVVETTRIEILSNNRMCIGSFDHC